MIDPVNDDDETFMQQAIDVAFRGEGFVEPNPMVGCVIVRDGKVIGQGHHEKFGDPHAEIMALRSLPSMADARDATVYVTLEPCSHHGKTPPCTDALIDAAVKRVVVAIQDPFDKVNGTGIQRLADAGIRTTVGVLTDQAANLIAPFAKQVRSETPWVIAKWAMTADGKIATTAGQSQWITGQSSRAEVHRLRGRVDAIVTAMGTVIADDPRLTARPPGPRNQVRVVLCRNRLPPLKSQLIQTASQSPVWLFTSDLISIEQTETWQQHEVKVIPLATNDPVQMVRDALHDLGQQSMTNVMVEGGGELLGSFLLADQIDECHVFVGAKLFGGTTAMGPIGGPGIKHLSSASNLALQRVDKFENDVRMIYRRSTSTHRSPPKQQPPS